MAKMVFDELNDLYRQTIDVNTLFDDPRKAKELLYDYLIDAYTSGYQYIVDKFDLDKPLDVDKMNDAINKVIADKTWSDRADEYIDYYMIEELYRVAETEIHRVYNAGIYDTALGLDNVYKQWITMADDKVRDTHEYLEFAVVPLEERFKTFDGDTALYPSDFEKPQNNINCRCWIDIISQ